MRTPVEILQDAITEYDPVAVFGFFSGGFDSLCATYIASEHPRFTAAVHINTGIGVEETRRYVRQTCKVMGWPLIEKHPPAGSTYVELIAKYGFPGPGMHYLMYRNLKERAVRELVREHKTRFSDRVMLVTGVREGESVRRMGNVQEVHRDGAQVWVAPIINFSKLDTRLFTVSLDLPQNPVANNLHMSGECLCGAFAKEDELESIRLWYPEDARRLDVLQRWARMRGVKRWRWGWGGMRKGAPQPQLPGFLCAGCGKGN